MPNPTREIRNLEENELAQELIGKRITHINTTTNQLTLDDGTTLALIDTSDCCAYFNAQLEAGNFTDNAITRVQREDIPDDEYGEHWALHILAGDDRIASVDISGTSGSGYYCHSINLEVFAPKENS